MLLKLVRPTRVAASMGASSISKLIDGILKGVLFFFCVSLVVVDTKLLEKRSTEAPLDESLNVTNEPYTNSNLKPEPPDLKENDYESYENVAVDLHPNGISDLGTENNTKEDLDSKEIDVSNVEDNSSNNDSEGSKDIAKASDDHSNEVVFNENLSLREILRRLMPPQLSTIGESEPSTSKTLSSTEYNPTGEEYEKDEDMLQSSGSDVSCNASTGTSDNGTLNAQENVTTKAANGSVIKKAACVEMERHEVISDVEIINATALQQFLQTNPNVTSRSSPAKCFVVYFFSPYCPFSTQGSAYVNALARALPNIPVYGIDSVEYHSPNARYGIMGTPSLVLFHNGNVAGRFNASEFSTYHLESFIHHFTDQKLLSINVTSMDFKANLPSQTLRSTPYALYFAWAFLLTCGGYLFLNSKFYATLMEAFVNNWREAEAQHEHDD